MEELKDFAAHTHCQARRSSLLHSLFRFANTQLLLFHHTWMKIEIYVFTFLSFNKISAQFLWIKCYSNNISINSFTVHSRRRFNIRTAGNYRQSNTAAIFIFTKYVFIQLYFFGMWFNDELAHTVMGVSSYSHASVRFNRKEIKTECNNLRWLMAAFAKGASANS